VWIATGEALIGFTTEAGLARLGGRRMGPETAVVIRDIELRQ
jgi:hypothetical protein